MQSSGWLQLALYVFALAAITKPMGLYLLQVLDANGRRAGKGKKGPYYLWTCKVKGRTRCLALSKTQDGVLAEAIANNRRLQRILDRMHALSLKLILKKTPGVRKRK